MITVTDNGDGTKTFAFSITANSTKMDSKVTDWAHYDFDHGYGDHGTDEEPKTWDDLSNKEKLDAINARLIALGKAEAESYYKNDAVDTAKDTADSDLADRY